MEWNKEMAQKIEWNDITNLEQKIAIGQKIANKVKNGDVIGVGSGSTSFIALKEIAKKVKQDNLKITAIPTSYEIEMLCMELKIPVTNLINSKPDWSFDGADEVNDKNWLIKGRGGAMFREKLNIAASEVTYILVDNTKFVENICDKFPIPIETNISAINYVRQALVSKGATEVKLRLAKGKDGPVITENGNAILDAKFNNVDENLEKELKSITGVIETGLFIGYNIIIEK